VNYSLQYASFSALLEKEDMLLSSFNCDFINQDQLVAYAALHHRWIRHNM